MRAFAVLAWVLSFCFCAPLVADSVQQPAISLILDDLGYNLAQGQRALRLPGPVTYAVIPYTPHSVTLARQAHAAGKEVMLHLPMDDTHQHDLGPHPLSSGLSQDLFEQRLDKALRAVPHISGINNHMGSQLTEEPQPMAWLMQTLSERPLYFIDSRTSAHSVAAQTAQHWAVPNLKRDVFLDHDPRTTAIAAQFERLLLIAKKQGYAVGIGHPYPTTLEYLERMLPLLDSQGIRLVAPSGLLAAQQRHSPVEVAKTDSLTTASDHQCHLDQQLNVTRVVCS